jgi:UDP-N-acetylglucosamine:LPS N-acetylglucosamine transferase
VFPAVRPEFRAPLPGRDEWIRRALALPPGPLALLCSGSWGVGQVLQSAVDLVRHTRLIPVVVCGRNDRLRRRVARVPGAVALGWVDDMAGLMRACQVAVLNSGGLTLAEAVVSGLPVVHYRPLAGQGAANARFGMRSGWSPYCRDATQLDMAIRIARARTPRGLPTGEAADAIIEMLVGATEISPVAGSAAPSRRTAKGDTRCVPEHA